jgi:hypothetical protein
MLRKSNLLFAAIIILLGNSAFIIKPGLQSQTSQQGSWFWLFIVILIIFGVSLLLILRSNATPAALAEYGLDQHGHDHGENHPSAAVTSNEHGDVKVEQDLA